MSTNRTSYHVFGRKASGESLHVAIYADSQEDAERQYTFRYRSLGYMLDKEFTETQDGESMPIMQIRKRTKPNELRQSDTQENPTLNAGTDAGEPLCGSLDDGHDQHGQDHQNVVFVGE
jgi:hypothetical protein